MDVKNKKAAQSEITQQSLISAARNLFAAKGYGETAAEQIVQAAGVTRGALYHHFRGKEDLFRAVVETVERETAERIQEAASAATGPWERLQAGCQAFLDACLEPAVRRIVLLDAPSVLGVERWRSIDAHYGLNLISLGLRAIMDAGLIERQPVEPLAHLLLGALSEAGVMLASADDVQAARLEVGASLDRLLSGLKVSSN